MLSGVSRMLPGLLVSLSVVALMQIRAWEPVEQLVHNQVVRWRGIHQWDDRLIVVNIDDRSLSQLGQFPISRDYYARLVKQLREKDASVVVFNLILSDETLLVDSQTGQASPETISATAQLAKEMSAHGRVVIGQIWGPEGEVIKPVSLLADMAIATGHMRLPIDTDGYTRFAEITYKDFPALGVAAIQAYSLEDELVSIPTDLQQLRINWPGPVKSLNTVSLIDVLSDNLPPSTLAGKIVIVSYGATSGLSPMRTPFDNRWPVPGGYMHAAVIDNLLNQNWLRSISQTTILLGLLIGGPLFSGLLYRRALWMQVAVSGAAAGAWLTVCIWGLHVGYLLPVVPPLVTLLATGAGVIMWGRLQSNALLQVRSAFLSTMSHEIRTPLNAIVNLSEMLQDTELNNQQREYVETLSSSSQTLMALINDVLDFSKIESGRLTLEDYPVSLVEILERSTELLAPRAAEKAIELVYAIEASAPTRVVSDPVRLQQILINLLSNAVKFTERGEVALRVSARPAALRKPLFLRRQFDSPAVDAENLYELRFEVRDTGIGIPPEKMAKLFDPFSQVSTSTTRKYGGTGLGLSISKRLSERMGGSLWAKSTPGEGSAFYFTCQAQAVDIAERIPDYLSALQGARLLLIDRNKTRCEQIGCELQRLGILLVQARSVAEAVALMRDQPAFDGVILDEALAQRFGDTAAAVSRVRQSGCNQSLPVIVMCLLKSNFQHLADESTVLWKPVKQMSLYQALRSICPVSLTATAAAATRLALPDQQCASKRLSAAAIAEQHALKILIAEDNRTNQRVALRLLELLGYQADVASSGTEVLTRLARSPYDVILMDMRMPDMDGIETTLKIRQIPEYGDIWIIAMTANAMSRDRKRCLAAGMNDYLSKPIKREVLDQALRRCPARQQAG